MSILDSAIETRDYDLYLNTYGLEGERDFELYINKFLVSKGYKLYNVVNIKEYLHNSIDYVIDKLSRDNLPVIDEVINDDNFIKIEVKNSFTALKTGRLAYELTTSTELNDRNRKYYYKKYDKSGNLLKYGFDCVGWSLKTKSDYIYHTFSDKDTHEIKKRAWIDMKKWHEFVKNPLNELSTNIILDERVVDILCKIDLMERQGILKFIKT